MRLILGDPVYRGKILDELLCLLIARLIAVSVVYCRYPCAVTRFEDCVTDGC